MRTPVPMGVVQNLPYWMPRLVAGDALFFITTNSSLLHMTIFAPGFLGVRVYLHMPSSLHAGGAVVRPEGRQSIAAAPARLCAGALNYQTDWAAMNHSITTPPYCATFLKGRRGV